MANLTPSERQAVGRGLMRFVSTNRIETAVTKPDIITAITYTDQWLESNAASFNSGLPASVKAMPSAFKAMLLAVVALAKFSMTFLVKLIGDTN